MDTRTIFVHVFHFGLKIESFSFLVWLVVSSMVVKVYLKLLYISHYKKGKERTVFTDSLRIQKKHSSVVNPMETEHHNKGQVSAPLPNL